MQDKIQTLLTDVAFKNGTLKEAKRLYADRFAPDFNIFDYLRDDEMGLSQCIANLLKPAGTHGQGSVFLVRFLKCIDQKFPEELHQNWLETATDACQVNLENQANGQRRIDVYLRFKNGEIIGIENKPWAGDQEDQLTDYAKFIESEAKSNKWMLIYLSNYEPSEDSIKKVEREKLENSGKFIRLSYDILIEWLQDCACRCKALVVRVYIEELVKFIRMKINGELDMAEENEMKKVILASPKNLESAFHVFKAINRVKEELLKDFHDDLKAKLKEKRFELVWDENMSKSTHWNSKVGFGVKFYDEQNYYLRFQFWSSGLHDLLWGISPMKDKSINKEDDVCNQINAVMSVSFGSGGKPVDWPWWSWIDKKEFGPEFRHWDKSEMPWLSIHNKELAGKITTLAISVHEAFKENQNLLTDGVIK